MKQLPTRLIIVLCMLMGAALACNLPASNQATPPPTIPAMNSQDALTLQQQIEATLSSPNANGEVTLTLSQAQLNALIASQISQQKKPVFTDSSVVLSAGQMEVYGKVNQSGIAANVKIVLQPAVDAAGEAHLNVVSIDLGGIPLPDVLKSQIESTADDALNSSPVGSGAGLKARSIVISEGQITLTGTRP